MWMLVFVLVTLGGGVSQSNFRGFYDEITCYQFGQKLADKFESPEYDSYNQLADIKAAWFCIEIPSSIHPEGFLLTP